MTGTYKEKFTINLVSNEDTIDVEVLNVGTTLLGGKKELHIGRGKINIHEAIRSNNIATNLVIPLIHEPKSYKKGFVTMTGTINSTQPNQNSSNIDVKTDTSKKIESDSSVTSKSNDVNPETNKKTESIPASDSVNTTSTSNGKQEINKKTEPAHALNNDDDDDEDELKILPVNGSQKYFITKIIAKDIQNAEILGSNDNFLLLNIGSKWSVETSVVEGSGSTASWTYTVEKDKQMTIELSNQEVSTYYISLTHLFLLPYLFTRSLVTT